jgi:hypothetical protein
MPKITGWFALIDQWRTQGMGEMGPTLPFVVGALALKTGRTASIADAEAILDDMIAHPMPGVVIEVSWCPNIGAPVFTRGELNGLRMRSKIVFPRTDRTGDALVFGENLVSRWKLKDAAAGLQQLVDDAAGPIKAQQFSRNWDVAGRNYIYGPFLSGEIDYIKLQLA